MVVVGCGGGFKTKKARQRKSKLKMVSEEEMVHLCI